MSFHKIKTTHSLRPFNTHDNKPLVTKSRIPITLRYHQQFLLLSKIIYQNIDKKNIKMSSIPLKNFQEIPKGFLASPKLISLLLPINPKHLPLTFEIQKSNIDSKNFIASIEIYLSDKASEPSSPLLTWLDHVSQINESSSPIEANIEPNQYLNHFGLSGLATLVKNKIKSLFKKNENYQTHIMGDPGREKLMIQIKSISWVKWTLAGGTLTLIYWLSHFIFYRSTTGNPW